MPATIIPFPSRKQDNPPLTIETLDALLLRPQQAQRSYLRGCLKPQETLQQAAQLALYHGGRERIEAACNLAALL